MSSSDPRDMLGSKMYVLGLTAATLVALSIKFTSSIGRYSLEGQKRKKRKSKAKQNHNIDETCNQKQALNSSCFVRLAFIWSLNRFKVYQ